jgi:ribosomal protein L30E
MARKYLSFPPSFSRCFISGRCRQASILIHRWRCLFAGTRLKKKELAAYAASSTDWCIVTTTLLFYSTPTIKSHYNTGSDAGLISVQVVASLNPQLKSNKITYYCSTILSSTIPIYVHILDRGRFSSKCGRIYVVSLYKTLLPVSLNLAPYFHKIHGIGSPKIIAIMAKRVFPHP